MFRRSLEQHKDFNGNSAQRGYPDKWMWSLEISTKEMRRLYIHTFGASILTSLSLTSNSAVYLVFRAICWLWSWNITCSRVGRKHIGNQGQCTVSFPRFICLNLSQRQLRSGQQRKALTGQRTLLEIIHAVGGFNFKDFSAEVSNYLIALTKYIFFYICFPFIKIFGIFQYGAYA